LRFATSYALRLLVMPLRPQQMRRRLPLTDTTLQRVARDDRRLFRRRLAIVQAFVLEVSFPLRPQHKRRRLPQTDTTLQRLPFDFDRFLRFAIVLSCLYESRSALPASLQPTFL
jgi:antitoxin (DNA-binding transcriptional repressor) of toxin-antitoxin stability system